MDVKWLIYILIFALGFMVGRIATTIQFGLKYKQEFEKLKKRFEEKHPPAAKKTAKK